MTFYFPLDNVKIAPFQEIELLLRNFKNILPKTWMNLVSPEIELDKPLAIFDSTWVSNSDYWYICLSWILNQDDEWNSNSKGTIFSRFSKNRKWKFHTKTWTKLVSPKTKFDFDRPYLNPHGFQILIFDMFAMNISNQDIHWDFLESFWIEFNQCVNWILNCKLKERSNILQFTYLLMKVCHKYWGPTFQQQFHHMTHFLFHLLN